MERATRIRELLDRDRYAAGLGISLVEVTDTEVVVAMPVTSEHENFHDGIHGGAVFSLADCAFSLASNAAGDAVAIDTHMAFTAGADRGDTLTATAVEVTRGRTLGTYRVTVSRADGRTCALFTGTVYILPG